MDHLAVNLASKHRQGSYLLITKKLTLLMDHLAVNLASKHRLGLCLLITKKSILLMDLRASVTLELSTGGNSVASMSRRTNLSQESFLPKRSPPQLETHGESLNRRLSRFLSTLTLVKRVVSRRQRDLKKHMHLRADSSSLSLQLSH